MAASQRWRAARHRTTSRSDRAACSRRATSGSPRTNTSSAAARRASPAPSGSRSFLGHLCTAQVELDVTRVQVNAEHRQLRWAAKEHELEDAGDLLPVDAEGASPVAVQFQLHRLR